MGYLGKGPIRIPGKLYDGVGVAGTSGYILSSTATGTQWVPAASAGSSDFLGLDDTPESFTASKFLAVNSAGTAIEFVDAPSGGGSTGMDITLGTPTDGSLSASNALVGFTTTTKVTDAIDDINEVLGKLAPAKPPNLSAKTLSLTSSYSATETTSGQPKFNSVTDNTRPRTSTVEEFWDGESGTLTANVNGSANGSRALTSGDDSGTYTSLVIDDDFGYPVSGTGAGFWSALDAYIQSSSDLSLGENTYQMKHSDTGDTNLLTFYVDDPGDPTISGQTFNVTGASSRYISGVPSIDSNQTINVSFTINNAIKTFYNTSKVATVSGTSILSSSRDHQITGAKNYGDTISVSNAPSTGSLTVGSNKYSETNTLSIQGFNSKGTGGTSASLTLTNVRVDTKSDESGRIFAGSGQYPTTYGTAAGTWDSTQNLISNNAYREELQLVGGVYKRPTQNYASNSPTAGPNYSSDTQTGYRYVLFNVGTISNATSVTINLNNASNISNLEQSDMSLQVKVDGANQTNGWINANSAYSAGNPTNNGDPALDFGASTATVRRITFGTAVKTGTVYVRFGLPTGSNKSLGSITKS